MIGRRFDADRTLIRKQHEDNRRRRRLTEDGSEAKLEGRTAAASFDDRHRSRHRDEAGEMLALRFADVDLTRLLITLRGTTTKSRKTRFVPIATERLRAVLEWLRLDAAGEKKPDEAVVFSDEASEPVWEVSGTAWVIAVLRAHGVKLVWLKDGVWRDLAPECKAQFRAFNLHWHDLSARIRHAWVERGGTLAQVRDLLGHAFDDDGTYDNQTLGNLQAAAAKLEAGKVFAPATGSPHQADFHEAAREDVEEHSNSIAVAAAGCSEW
ncbi:MAG: site-specific integrase [Desulfobacterales bacterium]|nr:site-specific integrase [Desulfobacterales bacterium]